MAATEDQPNNHLQSESQSSVLFMAGAISGIAEGLVVQPFGTYLRYISILAFVSFNICYS